MSMSRSKKYLGFCLCTETESDHTYDDYSEAFADYMRYGLSATLYGVTKYGSVEVIFSK